MIALRTTFRFEGRGVRHAVSVRNTGKGDPGWPRPPPRLQFPCRLTTNTPTRITTFCLTRWNPRRLNTAPNGPSAPRPDYYLACNVTRIPLSAELFARDSHCMVNLKSKSICVLERDRPPHPRGYRKLPVHADLVHAAKADALHLRRAVAQHPRRGRRPPSSGRRSPAPPALSRTRSGRPRWIWRLTVNRRHSASVGCRLFLYSQG